jgi:hypothetical protein
LLSKIGFEIGDLDDLNSMEERVYLGRRILLANPILDLTFAFWDGTGDHKFKYSTRSRSNGL